MADFVKLAMRGSILAAALLFMVVMSGPALSPGAVPDAALTARGGGDLEIPKSPGVYPAEWYHRPVLLFVLNDAQAMDLRSHYGDATPTQPLGNGLRFFAISAVSTHLGCTVAWRENFPPGADGTTDLVGTIQDPCHQMMWNPFAGGEPTSDIFGVPRLALLDAKLVDGALVASAYDGPIGASR